MHKARGGLNSVSHDALTNLDRPGIDKPAHACSGRKLILQSIKGDDILLVAGGVGAAPLSPLESQVHSKRIHDRKLFNYISSFYYCS